MKKHLTVHLIADGTHVHPAVMQLVYRLKGADGIVLITGRNTRHAGPTRRPVRLLLLPRKRPGHHAAFHDFDVGPAVRLEQAGRFVAA